MEKIKIKSYGKVNLSLDVTGKRDDGYHEIQTLMQKISLFDDVTVTWTGRESKDIEISLTCDKPYLPTDRRNLAYAGAEIMARQFAGEVGGGLIEIKIEKHIPVAAGLAGGKRQRSRGDDGSQQDMGYGTWRKRIVRHGRGAWRRRSLLYTHSEYGIWTGALYRHGSKAHSFKEQIQTCGAACKTSFRSFHKRSIPEYRFVQYREKAGH